jgi:hypothetical protein
MSMSRRLLLKKAGEVKKLALRLSQLDRVNKLDKGPEDKECWALAIDLHDLEGSFSKIMDRYIPKLMAENVRPKAIEHILFDIGMELQHIHYHITHSRYFAYMLPDQPDQ